MHKFTEGEIEISFSNDSTFERFDFSKEQGMTQARGLCLVDLLIHESQQTFLVEIKDPSCAGSVNNKGNENFEQKITTDMLPPELAEKARDSYTFLHLMDKINKPLTFVFLLGAEALGLKPASLLTLKEKIIEKIRQECNTSWQIDYVRDCAVFSLETWNENFPRYLIKRIRK